MKRILALILTVMIIVIGSVILTSCEDNTTSDQNQISNPNGEIIVEEILTEEILTEEIIVNEIIVNEITIKP